jgi:peptidoglycan/xylan/chitin deacetylase (PgdA/CDA1 family)
MANHSTVFLMYHELEVPDRPICQAEPGYARYVLQADAFRQQIEYLKANGWQGLSVGQALAFPETKNVALTFDDGCETDLLLAAPILRKAGFNATFFITSGWLGKQGYLLPVQLKELSQRGFEIGCHSQSHAYLSDLDERGLRREIVDPKSQLEHILGQSVDHFSCPGGRYDQRALAVARSAGYHSVSTSRIEANSQSTNVFELGRVAILRDMPLSTFAAICDGSRLSRMRTESAIRGAAKQILGNRFYDRVRAKLLRR